MKISIGSLPPGASPFSLMKKGPKNQGLDLMSDKFVKAYWSPAQAPMKIGEGVLPRGSGRSKGVAKALTLSPSIISQAG